MDSVQNSAVGLLKTRAQGNNESFWWPSTTPFWQLTRIRWSCFYFVNYNRNYERETKTPIRWFHSLKNSNTYCSSNSFNAAVLLTQPEAAVTYTGEAGTTKNMSLKKTSNVSLYKMKVSSLCKIQSEDEYHLVESCTVVIYCTPLNITHQSIVNILSHKLERILARYRDFTIRWI